MMKRTKIKLEEKLNSLNEFSPFSSASIPVIDSNNNGLEKVNSDLNELLSKPDNFEIFNPNNNKPVIPLNPQRNSRTYFGVDFTGVNNDLGELVKNGSQIPPFDHPNNNKPAIPLNPQIDSRFGVDFTGINNNLGELVKSGSQIPPLEFDSSLINADFDTGTLNNGKSQYFQADFKPRSNLYLSGSESSPANLLAGVPLVQMGAEDSTKKTFKELLDSKNLQRLIADARSKIGKVSPTKEYYHTALIEQSMVHDVISGFVFGNNSEVLNKKLESLDPKYKEALKSKGFTDSSVRERYLAMVAAYGDQGFSPEQNPLSVVIKDIIQGTVKELESKGRTLEVDKRDDKGEVVRENGKITKEIITVDNFTKYLDDSTLQSGISKYVKSNADYHKGGYERIIADYQAKNPEIVPVTYTDEPNSVSKIQLENLSKIDSEIEQVQNKPFVLYNSGFKVKNEDLRKKENWDDYKKIQWGASSDQGLFFKINGSKEKTEKLYKDLVANESLERMDQITVLIMTLLKRSKDGGKLTNEQRQFLQDITNSNDSWTPAGSSTQSIDQALGEIKFK